MTCELKASLKALALMRRYEDWENILTILTELFGGADWDLRSTMDEDDLKDASYTPGTHSTSNYFYRIDGLIRSICFSLQLNYKNVRCNFFDEMKTMCMGANHTLSREQNSFHLFMFAPNQEPEESLEDYILRVITLGLACAHSETVLFCTSVLVLAVKANIELLTDDPQRSVVITHEAFTEECTVRYDEDSFCFYPLLSDETSPEDELLVVPSGGCMCDFKGNELGVGEGGAVYELFHHSVLKLFHKEIDYEKEKFMHCQIAACIERDACLRDYLCVAYGHCDTHHSIAMQRHDVSRNLESIIQKSGPLRLKESYAIICEVAKRLDALHKAGICHGDAKAKNMLLTDTGTRLIDYGQSKVITKENKFQAIHSDCQQLLWIVLQLRFHLPFKCCTGVQGLMKYDSSQPALDSQWDMCPEFYILCGPVFDIVTEEASEARKHSFVSHGYTIQNVLRVAHDLFGAKDLSVDNMCVFPHSNFVWHKVFEILRQLQEDHKSLDIMVKGIVDEFGRGNQIRLSLRSILMYHLIGLRQLLSIEIEEDLLAYARDLQADLKSKYDEVRGALLETTQELKEERRQREKPGCMYFIPFFGPLIKCLCHLVTGNWEGLPNSLIYLVMNSEIVLRIKAIKLGLLSI
jgi:hypothetical protein